jgi:Flp pilus assembly pilin Flp
MLFSNWSNPIERGADMRKLFQLAVNLQIWKNRRGQDLIEYALMAGFVAVAAGAIMPGVASSINVIFSKVNSVMILAASS